MFIDDEGPDAPCYLFMGEGKITPQQMYDMIDNGKGWECGYCDQSMMTGTAPGFVFFEWELNVHNPICADCVRSGKLLKLLPEIVDRYGPPE